MFLSSYFGVLQNFEIYSIDVSFTHEVGYGKANPITMV